MSKIRIIYLAIALFSFASLTTSCDDDDEIQSVTGISEFSPLQGGYGTNVLISGENFPIDASRVSVTINEIDIPILRSNEEQLLVEIPKNKEIGSAPLVITIDGQSFTTLSKFSYMRTRTVAPLPEQVKGGAIRTGLEMRLCFHLLPTGGVKPAEAE